MTSGLRNPSEKAVVLQVRMESVCAERRISIDCKTQLPTLAA